MSLLKKRSTWNNDLTMILAVAGSAIGFGNLLRFPAVAVQNGGGAFMIPYFICILLLGLPMVWVEWSFGRFAGYHGHGTLPGALQVLDPQKKWLKYLGMFGLLTPFLIFVYYCYIGSWTLAYSFFSLTSPTYKESFGSSEAMTQFFSQFLALPGDGCPLFSWAWFFLFITFILNFVILYFGIQKGIERLCKWVIPFLLILCVIMIGEIGFVNHIAGKPETQTYVNGFSRMWEPDFSALLRPQTWLAAAGQTFYTLSIGIGIILAYTSYLKKKDDLTLAGLTAASMNEVVEVIIGGSLLVPAIFMFFGSHSDVILKENGTFGLSFITMPLIIGEMPFPQFFSLVWFLILFAAGLTSTISLLQPLITFMEDEFSWSKKRCIWILGIIAFIFIQAVYFFFHKGVVDELDKIAGTLFITITALIQIVILLYCKGIDFIWKEIHVGAKLTLPKIFKPVIMLICPIMMSSILLSWIYDEGMAFLTMSSISPENRLYILVTRLMIIALFIILGITIHLTWRNKKQNMYHDHHVENE